MLDVLQNRCGLIYTLTVIFCASVFVFRLDFRRARFRRLLFNSSCSGEKEIFVHDIYFSSVFEEEIPGGWSEKYVQEKKLELASGEIIKKINGSE